VDVDGVWTEDNGAGEAIFKAMYEVEWSPSATRSLHSECETSSTIPVRNVVSTIRPPVASSHSRRGSVSVRLPAPSDSADFDMSSWRASEVATNVSESVLKRSRRDMRGGISGVMSLFEGSNWS
jgi:hypothetical protein